MPRQRRPAARPSAPRRPAGPVPASSSSATATSSSYPHQQTRPASSMAPANPASVSVLPVPNTAAPTQGPGLFGQMASTAAGVALGSSIGHAIGSLFSSGSSSAATDSSSAQPPVAGNQQENNNSGTRVCDVDARNFTKCMDENSGNMQICGWYLEQLKACQSAASQY